VGPEASVSTSTEAQVLEGASADVEHVGRGHDRAAAARDRARRRVRRDVQPEHRVDARIKLVTTLLFALGTFAIVPFGYGLRTVLRSTDDARARVFADLGFGFLIVAAPVYLVSGAIGAMLVAVALAATTQPAVPPEASTTWRHMSMKQSSTPEAVVAGQARCRATTRSEVHRIASPASCSLPCGKWW